MTHEAGLSFPYRRKFTVGEHRGEVVVRSGMRGNFSELSIDGAVLARDHTPATGVEGARNHKLTGELPDGRRVEVEAGYINWWNIGIAVRVKDELVHESHPGKRIAMPDGAKKMLEKSGSPENYDPETWNRNKIPISVDIGLGLLFFVVAKLTDLTTAAFVGAAAGLILLAVQKVTRIDLLGGLAMFGILLLLVSAGLALMFQSDEAVKYRTTVVGLFSATLFVTDGLTGGKRLGARLKRYLPYKDIDPRRLALGMGAMGLVMASLNQLVAMLASTDVWLYYSTFFDFVIAIALIYFVFQYARGEMWRGVGPTYREQLEAEPLES
ncbi:septation protein IspZ [Erythrobacter sp.]|jgi:intracellular septation protein A|uniref:septation protein IspZ n=1 Tax=Erythrobacter sp. TaxID=1042 RepID=UPI002EA65508|nr:septation protein IspZ [Erythrobacter sp.]